MAEMKQYRHPVTNRVRWSDNDSYMTRVGFEPYDGEVEKDKRTGHVTALTGEMTKDEMKELAEQRELPTSGTKDELIARIAAFDENPPSTTSNPAGDTE